MTAAAPRGAPGLSVVVPCLDEEANVPLVYAAVLRDLGDIPDLELLYVDDGSTDATLAGIRDLAAVDPRVSFVSFTRNFGLEAAFSAGYRYARHPWILHLDADLQFPAAEGRRLWLTALEGYDAVFGVRVVRRDGVVRRWAAQAYHRVGRALGIELPPGGTTFRVVRADVARRIVDLRLPAPYFLASVPRLTSRWTTLPVEHRPRLHGRSKFGLAGLLRHALSLYVGFSRRPLHWTAAMLLVLAGALALAGVAVLVGAPVPAAALPAGFATLGTAALGAAAVGIAYLDVLHRGTQALPQYQVAEANVPVAEQEWLGPTPRPGLRPAAVA